MDPNNILSLLGLALRGGNVAVGEEPVEAVARAKDARVLLVASDAADNTRRRAVHFAEAGQCLWLTVPFTKADLGQATGRSSAAIVAVTDIGLANAIVRRLADIDPVHYDEAAAKLDLKAKRAMERRAEQRAHEKNVRTGKYKAKPAPTPAAPVQKAERSESAGTAPKRPPHKSRPSKENRPKPKARPANRFAHSRPVKKGKGSFRRNEP